MFPLVVTGRPGSGKSAFCQFLQPHGFHYISADRINSDLLGSNNHIVGELLRIIGVTEDKVPEDEMKSAMRSAMLNDRQARMDIENILHPVIMNNMDIQARLCPADKQPVVEIPLLFEAGLTHLARNIILVTARHEILLSRLVSRPGINHETAKQLLGLHMDDTLKYPECTGIVVNDTSITELEETAGRFARYFNDRYKE